MTLFHVTAATLQQAYAYYRYAWEKRDPRVALLAVAVLLLCAVPALLIDLLTLPIRWHDWRRAQANRARGGKPQQVR